MENTNYLINRRAHLKLAVAFLLLNILDGILTKILWVAGGYELNPIARHTLLLQANWSFWAVKVGVALICVFFLLWYAPRFPKRTKNILTLLVFAMLAICLFNTVGLVWL